MHNLPLTAATTSSGGSALNHVALVFAALSVACTGTLGSSESDNGKGDSSTNPESGPDFHETEDGKVLSLSASTTGIRRLRRTELEHSVRNLLPSLSQAFDVISDIPKDNHVELAFAVPGTVSEIEVKRFSDLAEAALASTGAESPAATYSCSGTESECAKQFIRELSERAFRRPPHDEEIGDLVALYSKLRADSEAPFTHVEALDTVTEALLQSPGFLYRWELGPQAPATSGELIKYGSYEMASRLSYFLWNSPPDAELLSLAAQDQLKTEAEIEAQTRRLLSDAKFDRALEDFVVQWLEISDLQTIVKDEGVYPNFNPELAKDMYDEAGSFLRAVYRGDAPTFDELLTATTTQITPELAGYYGVSLGEDGFADLSATERRGILMQGAVLSAKGNSYRTSPVRRGKFILNRLLCSEVPPPPPDAVVDLPPADPNLTLREQLAAHASSPSCNNCHATMDPLGLAFEHFDGAGAYREQEGNFPVDASGELTLAGEEWAFENARELVDLLVAEPMAHECFALQWLRYGLDRFEQKVEAGAATKIIDEYKNAHLNITELIVAITKSKPFTHRAPSEGEVLVP